MTSLAAPEGTESSWQADERQGSLDSACWKMLQGLQRCRVGIAHRVPRVRQSWGAQCMVPKCPLKPSSSSSFGTAVQGPSSWFLRRCRAPEPGVLEASRVPASGVQQIAGAAGGFWGCSVSKRRCCFFQVRVGPDHTSTPVAC